MIIRFQYMQSTVEEPRVKALLKVTNKSVTEQNVLEYLMIRYPERHNIEITEIIKY